MKAQQKPGAPVVGFNHNISHKGRTFHVQTEDSGPQRAHIITHIFLGGNILASTKSLYTDIATSLSGSALFDAVRKRMEEQHKAMMRDLARGKHDAEIARRGGGNFEPGVLAGGARAPDLLVGGDKQASAKSAETTEPADASSLADLFDPPGSTPLSPSPAPLASPPPLAATPPPLRRPTPIPPARKQATAAAHRAPAASTPAATHSAAASSSSPAAAGAPSTGRKRQQTTSSKDPVLFGDDLVSDRRLDEVILTYLAADPKGSEKKRDS